MAEKNIREIFGVDYLLGAPAPRETRGEPAAARPFATAEELKAKAQLAAAMSRILEQLQGLPEQSCCLHDLVERTGLDLEQLLGVVEALTRYGLVEMVRKDRFGNHEIRMTAQGRQFLTR